MKRTADIKEFQTKTSLEFSHLSFHMKGQQTFSCILSFCNREFFLHLNLISDAIHFINAPDGETEFRHTAMQIQIT